MNDLGLDPSDILDWFEQQSNGNHELVILSDEVAANLPNRMPVAVRRCYISDDLLEERASKLGLGFEEVIAAVLPDPGSVMAGDFAEILVFIYHAARHTPLQVFGPKKWRLKQDRTKPCPHSDVVQFILPHWPESSADDVLLCSEVKCKSTPGRFRPVAKAIEGCKEDQASRLARTLVWLRQRAILTDSAGSDLQILDRFIQSDKHPRAQKCFEAVAVVSSSLLGEALEDVPSPREDGYVVIIISVPELHKWYNEVYDFASRDCATEVDLSGAIAT